MLTLFCMPWAYRLRFRVPQLHHQMSHQWTKHVYRPNHPTLYRQSRSKRQPLISNNSLRPACPIHSSRNHSRLRPKQQFLCKLYTLIRSISHPRNGSTIQNRPRRQLKPRQQRRQLPPPPLASRTQVNQGRHRAMVASNKNHIMVSNHQMRFRLRSNLSYGQQVSIN